MKFTKVRIVAIAVIILIIVLGLATWTVTSPPTLKVQSQSELQNSVFSYSKAVIEQDFSDGSGTYGFKFGFDYTYNLSVGAHVQFAVYAVLVNQSISSPFAKGVALELQSSTLLVDGRQDSGVTTVTRSEPGLVTYDLQNPDLNIPAGLHNITTRLIVSTIDVNYIGNFAGSTQVISLGGVVNLTNT